MTHPATLLKNSWRAYAHDFRSWIILTSPLVALIVILLIGSSFIPGNSGPQAVDLTLGGQVLTFAKLVLILAAVILIFRVFSTALVVSSYRSLNGSKLNVKEAYKVGFRTFGPILWVSILRALIVLGGLILLIVPGVIWALRYSLATQAAILEGKRGMAALHRSKDLTNGKLFETFINFCTIFMVDGYGSAILASIAVFVLNILGAMVGFAIPGAAANATAAADILAALAAAVVIWLSMPLAPLAAVAVYKDYSDK